MDEEEKKVEKQSVMNKGVELMKKVLSIFENLPKAMIGIMLLVTLATGGTAAVSTFMSPGNGDIKALKNDIAYLKVWNEALRERTLGLMKTPEKIIEFDGYLLDLNTGQIEPLPENLKY
ncbi:MAG TPA: hypothetical protein VMW36_06465 [Patescibacteria group bacterium]|nr:hypothetical protein [Patescibacteria group bacterium]